MKALTIVSSIVFLHVLAFVVLVNGCSTRASRTRMQDRQPVVVNNEPAIEEPSVGEPVEGFGKSESEPTVEPERPAVSQPAQPEEETTIYVVKQNDSLWVIAKKHKTTVDAICKANGINKNVILRVGMKLKMPAGKTESAAETSAAPANGTTYTVKKGDALSIIARRNGISVKELKQANKLTSDNIRIGQKLIIPAKNASADKAPQPASNDKDAAPVAPASVPAEPAGPEAPEVQESADLDISAEPIE